MIIWGNVLDPPRTDSYELDEFMFLHMIYYIPCDNVMSELMYILTDFVAFY